jgi:hypothetical protein
MPIKKLPVRGVVADEAYLSEYEGQGRRVQEP